jgi:hypothetical protein
MLEEVGERRKSRLGEKGEWRLRVWVIIDTPWLLFSFSPDLFCFLSAYGGDGAVRMTCIFSRVSALLLPQASQGMER